MSKTCDLGYSDNQIDGFAVAISNLHKSSCVIECSESLA